MGDFMKQNANSHTRQRAPIGTLFGKIEAFLSSIVDSWLPRTKTGLGRALGLTGELPGKALRKESRRVATTAYQLKRLLSALDRLVATLVAPMTTWSRAIGG